jgi:hypothetical protein
MNSRVYDATNLIGILCIGAGAKIAYGLGVALMLIGGLAICLNVLGAFFVGRRPRWPLASSKGA